MVSVILRLGDTQVPRGVNRREIRQRRKRGTNARNAGLDWGGPGGCHQECVRVMVTDLARAERGRGRRVDAEVNGEQAGDDPEIDWRGSEWRGWLQAGAD